MRTKILEGRVGVIPCAQHYWGMSVGQSGLLPVEWGAVLTDFIKLK